MRIRRFAASDASGRAVSASSSLCFQPREYPLPSKRDPVQLFQEWRINTYTPKHLFIGHLMNTVRWNIAVSPDVDQSVRMFLAAQGGGRKGDLSRFIEEAVRAYLLEQAVDQAKTAATGLGEQQLNDLIDEAVQWAREH